MTSGTSHARQLLAAWRDIDHLESLLPFTFLLSLTFIPLFRSWHTTLLSDYRATKARIQELNAQ